MNQRIRHRAEQATNDVKDEFGHWIGSELDEEKFAQLIVEECSLVVERNIYKNIGYNTSRKIREHFGIVESEE